MSEAFHTPSAEEMAFYLARARQARSETFGDLFRRLRGLFSDARSVRPLPAKSA